MRRQKATRSSAVVVAADVELQMKKTKWNESRWRSDANRKEWVEWAVAKNPTGKDQQQQQVFDWRVFDRPKRNPMRVWWMTTLILGCCLVFVEKCRNWQLELHQRDRRRNLCTLPE